MPLNRLIALVLVAICFVAATFGIQRRQMDEALNLKKFADRDRLELVSLDGAITGGRSASGALSVRDRLRELIEEDAVKGVLLAINSPGGTVGTSKEIYAAVTDLAKVKPVVVSMLDQATSGGYYAACAATKIYANEGSLTGSIGVILSGFNAKELLDRVGVQSKVIKTGPYKDIFSSFRELAEPERQLLQELLQSTYQSFISDVAKGRKMDLEAIRKLADGRIYTGTQAKENGLVDATGTLEQAIADLRGLARKQFSLSDSQELPIRRSPASLERILDQLLSQSDIGITSSLANLLRSNVFTRVLDLVLENGVSDRLAPNLAEAGYQRGNYDPPVLLMPSWVH